MNEYDKIELLSKKFEEAIEKEAAVPLVIAGVAAMWLGRAWFASTLTGLAVNSLPAFKTTKHGVQKLVDLARDLKVKKGEDIVNQFVKDGSAIIPLFDVIEKIATADKPDIKLVEQLKKFVDKSGSFMNNISAVEGVIRENMAWYQHVGHFVAEQLGFGANLTKLQSFTEISYKLVPALSAAHSKAYQMYNNLVTTAQKIMQKEQRGELDNASQKTQTETQTAAQPSAPTQQETPEEVFSAFSDLW